MDMNSNLIRLICNANLADIELRIVKHMCNSNIPMIIKEPPTYKEPVIERKKKNWIKTKFYE